VTPQTLRTARSVTLFTGGLLGAAYEVVFDHADRPAILILLAGMMGLPAFLPSGKPDRSTVEKDKT
jgi:hypothetical protein